MVSLEEGRVVSVDRDLDDLQEITVAMKDGSSRAVNYPELTGRVMAGDLVRLNTTAVRLGLGSGGFHLVTAVLDREINQGLTGEGHIMKVRYTPCQTRVLAVEEEASPYRRIMETADDIRGMVVLAATLHSQLAPLAFVLAHYGIRPAYIMTDGAALPIALSHTVRQLKEKRIIRGSITCGHAFGGDLEAVNIYSGLLAARHVWQAEVAIVAMGPGIVGTGTRWGFTGIEQGQVVNAASALGGWPVVVPRISFADKRERHQGISHHTLTVLERVCQAECLLPLPVLAPEQEQHIKKQLNRPGLARHHQLWLDGGEGITRLAPDVKVTTMGRGPKEDPEFFLACGAAAKAAVLWLEGKIAPWS